MGWGAQAGLEQELPVLLRLRGSIAVTWAQLEEGVGGSSPKPGFNPYLSLEFPALGPAIYPSQVSLLPPVKWADPSPARALAGGFNEGRPVKCRAPHEAGPPPRWALRTEAPARPGIRIAIPATTLRVQVSCTCLPPEDAQAPGGSRCVRAAKPQSTVWPQPLSPPPCSVRPTFS